MTKVKNIHMSLTGIDESRAYSDSEVWSYYILPSTGFEFLDAQSREIMAKRIDTGYAALVGNKSKSVEIHLIVTSSPLNVESWALDWTSRAMERRWNVAPGFNNWVDECKEYLRTEDFAQKEIYLGVKLGSRSEYRDTGSGKGSSFFKTVGSSISSIGDVVAKYSGSSSQGVGSGEREYWEKKSRDVTRTLAGGNLKATPATADEIALLFKRTLYPAMPSPKIDVIDRKIWGSGELDTLRSCSIEKGRKFLRIIQTDEYGQEMEGYRATLSFSQFPDSMDFPYEEPWMHYAALLGLQFDLYSRITLEPARKIQSAIARKIAHINDEAENAAIAGSVPMSIQERQQVATELEWKLQNSNEPWAIGRHRIVVTAQSEEELRDRVSAVVQHYADLQIKVEWSTGDQLALLRESQPADRSRSSSYLQRQSLSVISGGMPTANSSVGD